MIELDWLDGGWKRNSSLLESIAWAVRSVRVCIGGGGRGKHSIDSKEMSTGNPGRSGFDIALITQGQLMVRDRDSLG